ncbi:VOC family protein [Nocardia sp. NPDC127579]|uniref:VOC family protein n=1 Tax=Nocardia sp. NPDC127579 TaxID=3345402 RepID=UPI003631C177
MRVHRIMPIVSVENLDQAIEAYRRVLDLDVIMNHGWIATLSPGDASTPQLGLMTKDRTAPCNPAVSIEVDDVDAAHAEAVAAGFEIVHPLSDEEWGVRRFFFRDPQGAVINVLTHR